MFRFQTLASSAADCPCLRAIASDTSDLLMHISCSYRVSMENNSTLVVVDQELRVDNVGEENVVFFPYF